MKTYSQCGVLLITAGLVAATLACGSEPAEPVTEKPDSGHSPSGKEVELEGLDVCALLPASEVAAAVGELREAEPFRDSSQVDHKGCKWNLKNGHYCEVMFFPLYHWGTVKVRLPEAEAVNGVGTEAYAQQDPDALWLEVLIEGRANIVVRASDDRLETAVALFELVVDHLP